MINIILILLIIYMIDITLILFKKYIDFVEDRKYNDKRYNISFNKLLWIVYIKITIIIFIIIFE